MISDSGEISVGMEDEAWLDRLPDAERLVESAVRAALSAACPGLGSAGVAVMMTNDRSIRTLNKEWRNKDMATNVLSFPATETAEGNTPEPDFPGTPLELGDIVIAREICEREALDQKKLLKDHVLHLTVHGTLHLLGYDHEEDAPAARMEQLETIILASLGVSDPYAPADHIDHG